MGFAVPWINLEVRVESQTKVDHKFPLKLELEMMEFLLPRLHRMYPFLKSVHDRFKK